ncbi:glycosyltransferase N-terminal domain-containing protein [Danxiaibacter flavus]|uniref:3-deoxy-D-manno-octulosonic acid transferase n=1 Tax=Danxiaibacter flavus TaxID=3049108 RepID=A0ABV3ZAM4_9BACT|nr:glycosyltransferase N-terminal domain-containing protein [Chitinophagaceae bacterium DXS]
MQKIFYNIFTSLYPFIASLISPFNPKARKWVQGRKGLLQQIEEKLAGNTSKTVWVHCASLGEFEQGRPLIEDLKKVDSSCKIVLTFFSPSGYEVQKKYVYADYIFYLPMDSASNAKKFYDIVNPSLILFVKYEFWYHYLLQARQRNIPLLLVSGIFRKSQPFFKSYGGFHRKMLGAFTHFFVQNDESIELLKSIQITNASLSGDTRFDRVLQIAGNFTDIPDLKDFASNHTVIVAGSTWTEDDEELDHYSHIHTDYRFIIAPHDISEERIRECETLYKHAVRYSTYQQLLQGKVPLQEINTIIIDNIGMLSRLYKYATICYVGGGFGGDGVHNVLEAAVYNKPVVFGPVYDKYFEAVELVEKGGAFTVDDALELEQQLDELLGDGATYKNACKNAGDYVHEKSGATGNIMQYIYAKRLLTN